MRRRKDEEACRSWSRVMGGRRREKEVKKEERGGEMRGEEWRGGERRGEEEEL